MPKQKSLHISPKVREFVSTRELVATSPTPVIDEENGKSSINEEISNSSDAYEETKSGTQIMLNISHGNRDGSGKIDTENMDSTEQRAGEKVQVVMGVSLAHYENGRSRYKRPSSLLWAPPEEPMMGRLRFQSLCNDYMQVSRKRYRREGGGLPPHFVGKPVPAKVLGVCAECGMVEKAGTRKDNDTDIDNQNVIILCDGPGCEREFHLKCCRPPLLQVPEEQEYFCYDCHPNGGYAATLLEDYFDETEREREKHNEECTKYYGSFDNENSQTQTTPAANRRRKRRTPQRQRNNEDSEDDTPCISDDDPCRRKTTKDAVIDTNKYYTFVDQLIYNDMKEHEPELISQLENGICSDIRAKGPPCSQLEAFHQSRNAGRRNLRTSPYVWSSRQNDNGNANEEDQILVGCAIRLYCTKTNSYHTGRILKVRLETMDYSDDPNALRITNDTECLVRFPAGRDHRKKTITRWIRLEEHAVAVAYPDLVWGKFDTHDPTPTPSKGRKTNSSTKNSGLKHRWMPAKLWLRSSRELVISMSLLEEPLGQISYRSFRNFASNDATQLHSPIQNTEASDRGTRGYSHGSVPLTNAKNGETSYDHDSLFLQQEWVLAECIGWGDYKLLHVSTEARTQDGSKLLVASKTTTCKKKKTNGGKTSPRRKIQNSASDTFQTNVRVKQIMSALTQVETAERSRVRRWSRLPLQNLWHDKALSIQDESFLGDLSYGSDGTSIEIPMNQGEFQANADNCDRIACKTKRVLIEQSPLIGTGLDRMYMMDQFITLLHSESDGKIDEISTTCTKDLASTLSCNLVCNETMTALIQEGNTRARDAGHLQSIQQVARSASAKSSLSINGEENVIPEADDATAFDDRRSRGTTWHRRSSLKLSNQRMNVYRGVANGKILKSHSSSPEIDALMPDAVL